MLFLLTGIGGAVLGVLLIVEDLRTGGVLDMAKTGKTANEEIAQDLAAATAATSVSPIVVASPSYGYTNAK
jgi:hypothetical protein